MSNIPATIVSSPLTMPLRSLGLGVLQDFNKLRLDTQAKNIAAWTPVVAEILQGFVRFDDKAVRLIPCFSTRHQPNRIRLSSSQDIFLPFTPWQPTCSQERWRQRSVKACGSTSGEWVISRAL